MALYSLDFSVRELSKALIYRDIYEFACGSQGRNIHLFTGGYSMGGKRDLTTLLSDMTPDIARPTYVYCTFPDRRLPVGVEAICQFSESEGLTAIIDKSDAERLNIAYEFAARMITLTVHSDLAAVGFLSVVFATLANAGIACNAVSAYHHDHLFVPDERSDEAMSLLQSLSEGGGKR